MHTVTAVEYVGNNLDPLLPRWGEGKFRVGLSMENREATRSIVSDLHFPTHDSI